MKRKHLIVLLTILPLLAVLIAGGMMLAGDGGKKTSPSQLKVLSENVDVEIKDVLYTEIGSDDVKWEIRADAARYAKGENLAVFDGIKVRLLLAGGGTMSLTGDIGEFRTDTKDMNVSGHVRVVTDRGDVFTTDRIRYTDATQRISADGPVTVENGGMRVSGRGLQLDLAKRRLSVQEKVRAQIR